MATKKVDQIRKEEEEHLVVVKNKIQEQLTLAEASLDNKMTGIMDEKKYLWQNIYELDTEEIAASRSTISNEVVLCGHKDDEIRLLRKQLENPYFGRLDFVFEGEDTAEQMYIGIGGLQDKDDIDVLVYDWRAPVSSMYYDFDVGGAYYEAPVGKIEGRILNKRQIKIRKGEMEYALEANFNVYDEILQKELSQNGSTKMRNIVATIQKEQNSIVRDDASDILVVQGVAGSGKTSIALHRIAFLLYKNRQSLKSSDVLILSPNTIFSNYISNVLPELGEQNISNVSFDEIALNELKGICKFESKKAYMEYIIHSEDNDARLHVINFKSGFEFLNELKEFVAGLEGSLFKFTDVVFKGEKKKSKNIKELFEKQFFRHPIFARMDKIADLFVEGYQSSHSVCLTSSERAEIVNKLYGMAKVSTVAELYKCFLERLSKKYSFIDSEIYCNSRVVRYEDAFAMVLMKLLLFGTKNANFKRIKHVVLDEMQDYSMIQYDIINTLFDCKMTILGDINQVVDRKNATLVDNIENIFGAKAKLIRMLKSFRSTYEISEFCRKLCNLPETVSFNRHGNVPSICSYKNYDSMVKAIQEKIDETRLGEESILAIICKSSEAAEKLYSSFEDKYKKKCYLMNDENSKFCPGYIVTNSYLVKGLEFDYVIIPDATNVEYKTERDRQLLYIASTRALHDLTVMSYGRKSKFLNQKEKTKVKTSK